MNMCKKITSIFLSIILVFGICITILPGKKVSARGLQGAGTELNPFLITDEATLRMVYDFPDACWKLTTNITLTGDWNPIPSDADENGFSGTFDGNGYTIDNLVLEDDYNYQSKPASFFRYNTGTIKNLTLKGTLTLSSSGLRGGTLVYKNNGTIENCSVWSEISLTNLDTHSQGTPTVGGVVYNNMESGIIRNCYSFSNLTYGGKIDYHNPWYIGGFAGENSGKIENCYACGTIPTGSTTYDGANGKGFIGYNQSTGSITNCYYDKDKAGVTDTTGGSYPKSSAAMKMQLNYTNWDFINVWDIDEDINNGYPYLQTENSVYKKVKGVNLRSSASLVIGDTLNLKANVLPSGATNPNVNWSTSNRYVATVENGVVTGISEGTANIIVTTEEGGYTATCVVTVTDGTTPLPKSDYTYDVLDDGTIEITGYTGTETALIIPNEIDGFTVTSIGYNAFHNNDDIIRVTMGNSITHIGTAAFYGCTNLSNITFSENVTDIGESAFYGCSSLTQISIPNSVKTIGQNAFYGCDNLSIKCSSGSAAESYAKNNGITVITNNSSNGDSGNNNSGNNGSGNNGSGNNGSSNNGSSSSSGNNNSGNNNSGNNSSGNSGTNGNQNRQTTITLKKAYGSVYVKGQMNINPIVSNGRGNTIYHSSNPSIALVSSSGKITGLKKGTAVVTVSNNGVSEHFIITVNNPSLNKKSKTLKVKKTFALKIKGGIGKATFKSNKKKVASVNKKGKITAKKKGKATITVKTNGITLKCKITVK